jgi:phage tail-like protein
LAIYGINYYGDTSQTFYGQRVAVQFSAAPFTSRSLDYGKMFLQWSVPIGAYTTFRLIRNPVGIPTGPDDGTVLIETNATAGIPSNFMDTGLKQGQFYYYAIFVLSSAVPVTWVSAGSTTGLVSKPYLYTDNMFYKLPGFYVSSGANGEITSADGNNTLYNFLSIFGFQLDFIRNEYDTLLNVYDPNKVAGGLLPALLHQFGLAAEPELGQKQSRVIARNAVSIHKQRGTSTGIQLLVTSYSGWATTVANGVNLALDNNEGSFEQGLGHWNIRADSPVAATLAYVSGLGWQDPTGAVLSNGYATVTTGATAGTIYATHATDRFSMIPVVVGNIYTGSIYLWANTTARSNQMFIDWYDINGAFISASTGTAANSVVGAWTTRISVTGTAPTNAQFARLSVAIGATAAGEVNRLDQFQFEIGSTTTAPQYARDQRITLYADRINEIIDPSFEGALTSWSTTNAALTSGSAVAPLFGAKEGVLTASAAGNAVLTTSQMKVYPNNFYTGSISVWSAATSRSNYVTISWYTAGAVLISTTAFVSTATTVGSWSRISVKGLAPANAATATMALTVVGAAINEVHYVDGALFELSPQLNTYFDGSTTINSASVTDFNWDAAGPNASPSYFYRRKTIKNSRLNGVLSTYLAPTATYTLLYAQGI